MERIPRHPSSLTPDIPKMYRMGHKGYTCSIRALYAFNGTRVVGRRLTVQQMAKALGPNMVVHRRPHDQVLYRGVFANTEDRLRGFVLYIKTKGAPLPTPNPQPAEWFDRRLILVTWDDLMYPEGHCVVIWPPTPELPELWSLRDPWRADGSAVSLKKRQLAMLLAGADYVLYYKDGDTPENLKPRSANSLKERLKHS